MDLMALSMSKDFPVLAGLVVAAALIVYVACRVWTGHRLGAARRASMSSSLGGLAEKTSSTKERAPGEREPAKFDYPRLDPCNKHFSTVDPVPYRPFRWGDYHVTMGIRNMAWDEWIEIDHEFPHFHKVCEYRIRTDGDRLLQVNEEQPGIVASGHAAAREFMHELAEYLSRRHPDVYNVVRHPVSEREEENGWYGEGRIKEISVTPFDTTYDLDTEDPLKVARMLIQEDFTIMLEGSDGRYYLQAGAICIPGFWRLQDKIGMPLEEIHTSGNVPQYQAKLQTSMERYFRRLPVDKPVVRNNYFFQVVQEPAARRPPPAPGSLGDVDLDELAWSATVLGDEHAYGEVRTKEAAASAAAAKANAKVRATPATFRLRTERQTLRRLPRTGAIVFTIRVYQTPLDALVGEPGVPGRMASAIRSWPEDVARYKGRAVYESILPYLDRCHAEQLERGVVGEEERKSAYPF